MSTEIIQEASSPNIKTSKKRKLQYRFNDNKDIILLREVQNVLPFKSTYGKILEKWDQVAENVNMLLGKEGIGFTGILAQSRFKTLLIQFKKDEQLSNRASGIEEEYNELTQLLTDLKEQVTNFNAI